MPEPIRSPVQERAQATRESLLQAAIASFASAGYDAASTRNIEEAAGVKRGLIRYHFGSKEALWKAATEWMFAHSNTQLFLDGEQAATLSAVDQLKFHVRAFVRFSAEHPELNRLMIREGMIIEGTKGDWRLQWMADHYTKPWYALLEELFLQASKQKAVVAMEFHHFYYILMGAATLMFSMAPEARRIADVDPSNPALIEAHADALLATLFPPMPKNATSKAPTPNTQVPRKQEAR